MLLAYILRIRKDRPAVDKLLAELRQCKPTDNLCRITIDGKEEKIRSDAVQPLRAKYPDFFETGDIHCLKKWWEFWR
jgi:hypothetical protein